MDNFNIVEIIGYIASILVMISLMMSSIVKLRWINFVGSALFAAYGLMIKAYPVFLVNGTIALINIYYLFKLFSKDIFSRIEIKDPTNDPYLKKFVSFYESDLKKFFPDFSIDKMINANLIFRNASPVGLFAYKTQNGNIEIIIDYAAPNYRDFKNARFIFSELEKDWKKLNYNKIIANSFSREHSAYLKKIGFILEEKNRFVKNIKE
jgi:hypothetical protein